MKNLFLTLSAIIAMGFGAAAQTTPDDVVDIETNEVQLEVITPAEEVKETKQEIKEREKRLRELNDDVAFAKASNSLKRGYFVIIADYIETGRMGYRNYNISSNTNFVLVQGDDGILQIAYNNGKPGVNGLGGWTAKGTVRNKSIKYAKNGDVHMHYNLVGTSIDAAVDITLYHNSKRALAQVRGSSNLTIYGELLPYRDKDHR